jgi:hypothetical protein
VVPNESSELGYPAKERKNFINANHMNMCRFKDKDDDGYIKTKVEIKRHLERRRLRTEEIHGTPPTPKPPPGNSTTVFLSIAEDGHFIGGDHEATTDAVLALLQRPTHQRHVSIRPPDVEPTDKYTHPRIENIRIYERAIHFLIGDGIRYYLKWKVEQLIKSVLELRNFALPVIIDYAYEIWYVWPATNPKIVECVRIPKEKAAFTREGYYHDDWEKIGGRKQGLPEDEPIWLKDIFPSIVWEQVAPAAAFLAAKGELRTPVNMDSWVISDRKPSELQRKKPKA